MRRMGMLSNKKESPATRSDRAFSGVFSGLIFP